MSDDSVDPNFRLIVRGAVAIVALIVSLPLAGILGGEAAAFLFSTALIVGIIAWIFNRQRSDEESGEEKPAADPLTTLQERYARGEISESEFEHRVERIIDSDHRAGRNGGDADTPFDPGSTDREPIRERN